MRIKFKTLFLALILFTLLKCDSYKNQILSDGGNNQAILNAIIDFSKTNNSYKKHSVFHVSIYDALFRKISRKVSEGNYESINGKSYENIIAVSILGNDNKHIYYLADNTNINSKGYFPSRYIEKDGKLFIWYDDEKVMDEKTIAIFRKYELIGKKELPMIKIDDLKKGVDYYFCRNNLKNYKKKISNIAIGYYDVPEIVCE